MIAFILPSLTWQVSQKIKTDKILLSLTVESTAAAVLQWKASFIGQISHHYFISQTRVVLLFNSNYVRMDWKQNLSNALTHSLFIFCIFFGGGRGWNRKWVKIFTGPACQLPSEFSQSLGWACLLLLLSGLSEIKLILILPKHSLTCSVTS